jgi:hypothetical protein
MTKQTRINCKKAIAKYRKILNAKPKNIHRTLFKGQNMHNIDCIRNNNNDILTHLENIAQEIYMQQRKFFSPTVPIYTNPTDHPPKCTCLIRQYPWHETNGFILEKRGKPRTPTREYFTKEVYDLALKNLSNNKAPGPDNIPNEIIKNLTQEFHDMLYLFFAQCYIQKEIPTF